MGETASFEHHCDNCVFLGNHILSEVKMDLYACVNDGNIKTVIARYGSEGYDYSSGLSSAISGAVPELVEAFTRAKAFGFKY